MHYNLFEDLWTELPFWIGGSGYDSLSSFDGNLDPLLLQQQQQDFFYQDPGLACNMTGMQHVIMYGLFHNEK